MYITENQIKKEIKNVFNANKKYIWQGHRVGHHNFKFYIDHYTISVALGDGTNMRTLYTKNGGLTKDEINNAITTFASDIYDVLAAQDRIQRARMARKSGGNI